MENSRKTPSVIAKLMGLHETPPRRQHVSRQERLLSENYLQKSVSIGKRPRKDSPNSLLGSKKRVNVRTYKDTLSRDFEQKSLHVVFNSDKNEENGKLPKKIVVLRPNLGNVQHGSGPSFLLDSKTVFAWEAKKQLLERHKMAKVSQRLQPDFVNSIGIKSKEGLKYESVSKFPIFKGLNFSSNLNTVKGIRSDVAINTEKNIMVSNSSTPFTVSSDVEPEAKNVQSFHGDTKGRSISSLKRECSSHLSDLSSEENSPIRSHEGDSISANCTLIGEEHSDDKVETYQHSPNSILETSFREDSSSSSECCRSTKTNLHGRQWCCLDLGEKRS